MECQKVFGKSMLEPEAIQSAFSTYRANAGGGPTSGVTKTKVSVVRFEVYFEVYFRPIFRLNLVRGAGYCHQVHQEAAESWPHV